jgi:hypothetical protein
MRGRFIAMNYDLMIPKEFFEGRFEVAQSVADVMTCIKFGLVIYGITFLITSSRIFQYPRNLFRSIIGDVTLKTSMRNSFVHRTRNGEPVLETDSRDEEDVKEIGHGYDFISCRMCIGVWIMFPFMFIISPFHAFAAYALSYFLATQERFNPCCNKQ